MIVTLDTHSGVPIYRQIADQVRAAILSGRLAAGEQLDSVRRLAAELRVNPLTVGRAYSLLEGEGLIRTRRGIGLFVCELSSTDRSVGSSEALAADIAALAARAAALGVRPRRLLELMRRHLAVDRERDEREDEDPGGGATEASTAYRHFLD